MSIRKALFLVMVAGACHGQTYIIRTFAGGGGNSSAGFGGDGGPAISAQLSSPRGIAISNSGALYIADAFNCRVRKVSAGVITTVVGDGSCTVFAGNNGPAVNAKINVPLDVAIDTTGNLYLIDSTNERVWEVSNGIIQTIAGNGVPGYSDDNGPATSAELNSSFGLVVDANGAAYSSSGDINNTIGLSIRKISSDTISRFAGLGSFGYTGDNGSASRAQFSAPSGLAFDPSGNFYFGDGSVVRKITAGVVTTVAGNGSYGFSGDNGPATKANLTTVMGIAVDPNGNLFIADRENHRVRMVSNGVITTIAGDGANAFGGDNGPAASAQLSTPTGVAIDSSGTVYFADSSNNRIRSLTPSSPTCSALVDPTALLAGAAGGSVNITIQTNASCPWAVQSLPDWVSYSGTAVGTGAATILLTVASNAGGRRTGTISIAGISVPVSQDGAPLGPVIVSNGVAPVDSPVSIIQAGSWISIYGTNLSPITATWNGDFPTSLGGVSVTIDGKPGYLCFVSPGQINVQAPDDTATGPVQVSVTTPNGTALSTVVLAQQAPSFLTFDGKYAAGVIPTSNGSGAYQNGAYDVMGPAGRFSFATRPVKRGEAVELYGVGFGPTNPGVPAGQPYFGSAATSESIQIFIGGESVPILFRGLTSSGLFQINVTVPADLPSGDQILQAIVGNGFPGTQTRPDVYVTVQ